MRAEKRLTFTKPVNGGQMRNSSAPHAPVPLIPDGGSPDVAMGLLPSTFQPVDAENLDVDMTPVKTRVKRKKESKMEEYILKNDHLIDLII